MMERVLTVGTITLATTLVMKALRELLKLPFRAIAVLVSRLGDLLESARIDGDAIQVPTFYSPPIDEYEFFGVLYNDRERCYALRRHPLRWLEFPLPLSRGADYLACVLFNHCHCSMDFCASIRGIVDGIRFSSKSQHYH